MPQAHAIFQATLVMLLLAIPSQAATSNNTMLAWAVLAENYHHLYISTRVQGQWSKPELVTKSKSPIITPSLSSDSRGNVWLVYIEPEASTGRLRIKKRSNNQWVDLPRVDVNTQNDWGPSILIDRKSTTWLAWVGYDGKDDDIYYTHWTGDAWKAPARVNTDDDWPDVKPILLLGDDGKPEIRWSGYNGSKYVQFVSRWNGNTWSPEKIAINPFAAPAPLKASLPNFLTDKTQAALHIPNLVGIQSTRLSNYD